MDNQTIINAAKIFTDLVDAMGSAEEVIEYTVSLKTGEVYFVEGNVGLDTNDGSDWGHAFKTLAYAITVSNASIALNTGWASRNKIYVKGDAIVEDLAIGATKCDIIGVGSCDAEPRARIMGAHTFTGSGTQMGMRFFNLEFVNDAADPLFTVTTPFGIEWHNCWFTPGAGCTNAIIIDGATATRIVLKDCILRAQNTNVKFATSAIQIASVLTYGLEITNCIIDGVIALDIDSTSCFQAYVRNSLFIATTFPVDDESDDVYYINNRFITAGDGSTLETVLDTNLALSVGNMLTSSNGCVEVPAFTTYA